MVIIIIVIGWLLTFVSKAAVAGPIGQEAGFAGIAMAVAVLLIAATEKKSNCAQSSWTQAY